ncbi:hypothetical protein [Chryseobacterium sp. c4a]|uniref:hypothetical protein n=1 Tax=Chryseobacterium sp. c4a TaxID=1573582 RepID=UPI00135A869D|nr:hypothetical protein [Chryseobacterium sp. c4a]
MKKLYIVLLIIPSLGFAQIASPNGQIQATINSGSGNIGIGTTNPQSKLDIRADENIPIIRGNGGYIPTGLRFIDDSYTQPGQVKEWALWKGNTWAKGFGFYRYDVNACQGEFQIKLLQKIEELTLYSIQQNKRIEQLEKEIKAQKK